MPDVVCSFRRGIVVRGKQAKILSDGSLEDLLLFADQPHPLHNKVLPIEIDAETPAKVYESEEIDDALTSVTERLGQVSAATSEFSKLASAAKREFAKRK
jgi:hypothetical protein